MIRLHRMWTDIPVTFHHSVPVASVSGPCLRAIVSDESVVLRRYHDEMSAHLDAMVLEANGIPARVMADTGGGMIPSMAIVFPVRLLVHADNAELARELLDTPPGDVAPDDSDAAPD